jgi:hypothetical protein
VPRTIQEAQIVTGHERGDACNVVPVCDARPMDRTVRAVLEGDDAAPGRIAAVDVARLVLDVQIALMRAAHVVLRRPKRATAGRYQALIEQATRLSFVRIEEGSFAGVMSLPDVGTGGDSDIGLEVQDLGYLAWQRLLDVVREPSEADIDPWLADAIVKLADGVNLGGRTRRIRLESVGVDGQLSQSVIIDEPTRRRMKEVSAQSAPQHDAVHGRLVEADFELHTARLRLPTGEKVKVEFADDYSDEILAVLRESGTFVGEVVYSRTTGQVTRVHLRQVILASEQLQLFGEFHQHRTVAELATEQGVSGPQRLDSLRSETVDPEELVAFIGCAEQL